MKAISIREMRSDLGHLDKLIESEGEIIVTRRGVPIARLLPVQGSRNMLITLRCAPECPLCFRAPGLSGKIGMIVDVGVSRYQRPGQMVSE